MWYGVLELIYSQLILQFVSRGSDPSAAIKNTTRSCPEGAFTKLYFEHPLNPELSGCYYKEGRDAPCGQNMRLYENDLDPRFGICDCDRTIERTLIFHTGTNACYPIFQQGYCETGMWLDISKTGTPFCTKNPCLNDNEDASSTKTKDLVLLIDGSGSRSCVEVGSRCGAREIVGFEIGRRMPICQRRKGGASRSFGIPAINGTKCRPGSYRASTGHCQPGFNFYD